MVWGVWVEKIHSSLCIDSRCGDKAMGGMLHVKMLSIRTPIPSANNTAFDRIPDIAQDDSAADILCQNGHK